MNNVFGYMIHEFRERANSVRDALLGGQATSFDEYKALCKQYATYLDAANFVADTEQRHENPDRG